MHTQSHFHFVGINGIGMSAIAKILHKQGHIVSGCDLACDLVNVQELVDAGCIISSQHDSAICHDPSITTIAYSSDVPHDAQELVNARSRGIATVQRAAVLAEIMRKKTGSIGVAGSHGKTTTTSIIGHILMQAELDPTIIVGGIMNNINNNARYGASHFLVAETDESDRSHLLLPVYIAVLTSIDFEHANTYKNLDEVVQTFRQFLDKIPSHGTAILCADDENIANMTIGFNTHQTTYGTKTWADFQIINIDLQADSSSFDIMMNRNWERQLLGRFTINLPSIYNVLNATAAIATVTTLQIPYETIKTALQSFQGVDRRFTLKGVMHNPVVEIYDDYGHHPTEIYHSLITARRKTKNKLVVVFQPQRYTRTFHLWKEFVDVFANSNIDHLIITDIYTANEPTIENVTAQNLVQAIKEKNPACNVSYVAYQAELHDIEKKVIKILSDDDLLLLLGAGKINKLADKLL
jgi:UDP-N-acetylmuramate--alanine ligase